MKGILPGICVHVDKGLEELGSRIQVSSGIRSACRMKGYQSDAFIPKTPWEKPSEIILSRLSCQGLPIVPSETVYIVKIPDKVRHLFETLNFQERLKSDDGRELDQLYQHPTYQYAAELVAKFAHSFCTNEHVPTVCGLTTNRANLETVTVDSDTQKLIGLHLDSWDNLPLRQRAKSTNRICINLGQDDRYLLFLNLSLLDLYMLLKSPKLLDYCNTSQLVKLAWKVRNLKYFFDSEIKKISPHNLRHEFCTQFPCYPVVSLKVSPGEAYIAPTENILHDGSSLGQRVLDVQFTVRGNFCPIF